MITRAWNKLKNRLDRPATGKCCFIHVPKCAGTSVINSIHDAYKIHRFPRRSVHFNLVSQASRAAGRLPGNNYDQTHRILTHYALSLPHVKCVTGHLMLSDEAFAAFRNEWNFITLLREPVARWISHYSYMREQRAQRALSTLQPSEFVETPVAAILGRQYVSHFASQVLKSEGLGAAIDHSIAQLREFALVGRLENLELFQKGFKDLFGRQLEVPHLNHTRNKMPAEFQSVLPRIRSLCAPDIGVYEGLLG